MHPTSRTESTSIPTTPAVTGTMPTSTTKSTTPFTEFPTSTQGPTTTTESTSIPTTPATTTTQPTTTSRTPHSEPPTTTATTPELSTTMTFSTTLSTFEPEITESPGPSSTPPRTLPIVSIQTTMPTLQTPTSTLWSSTTKTESTTVSPTRPTTTAHLTTTTTSASIPTEPPTITQMASTTIKSTFTSTGPPSTTTRQSTTQPTKPPGTTEELTTTKPTTPSTEYPTPSTTTQCVCIVNGTIYKPGDVIFDREDLGSNICLTMICSDTCELHNTTELCTTPMPTVTSASTTTSISTTKPLPGCPEWDVQQNETFHLCNCTWAKCIENTTVEIFQKECPPIENITCSNGNAPVFVPDEYGCCQHPVCDCVCQGWDYPHYITFDGLYYTYQGNCTYILMKEIDEQQKLKIYIDNVFCDPAEVVTCSRSLIISYESQIVKLINHNHMGAPQLEALKNGVPLKLPYSQYGVKILDSGINLVLEIPSIRVVITFGIASFSVTLPYELFGRNTQGHCGTCNNNQADDCMLPNNQLVESCTMVADYWLAEDINQPSCETPAVMSINKPKTSPNPNPIPCNSDSMCDLLKSSVFAECHPFVSPENFYRGCIFDGCHVSNPAAECTSLQTYAAACARAGICIHWRIHTKHCKIDCPSNKIYKPCDPAEQSTCEDNPNEINMKFITEGCFCPEGMTLLNKESDKCVNKCGCLDPEGIPREYNETFEYKCQNCICEESTKAVSCKPKTCQQPPMMKCTGPGFALVKQTDSSDHCCSVYICQCQSNLCPVNNINCPVGYVPAFSIHEGKCCPEHSCEPKKVCVHKQIEYQPGSSVPVQVCQKCICTNEVDPMSGLFKIFCELQQCQQDCERGYEYMESSSGECCGECVQTHCDFAVNGTKHLLMQGQTWSPPENKCDHYNCVKSGETLTMVMSHIVCPPFQLSNCEPDTIQTAANGCCKTCVEKEKACKLVSMKTHVIHKGCQSYEEVDIPYCEGSCNTYTKYSETAAIMQQSCACCKETRFSKRTVDLHCLDGDVVSYSYTHVEKCGCSHTDCNNAEGHQIRRRRRFTSV
nr:intestinal mucin-like protein isoform X1 [Solea senegalensis]